MGFVVYETDTGTSVRLVEKESTAKGMVTKNNKALMWEALHGRTYLKSWSHCSWSEFEEIAKRAQKSNYRTWNLF